MKIRTPFTHPHFFVSLFFVFVSCTGSRYSAVVEKGVASWYGPGFHGKKTANGERFNQNELTCAHKTMPFNTKVLVVNTANGKSVVVRVNDRGPYADNRIIDVSKAAAKKLGMLESGTAIVTLHIMGGAKQKGVISDRIEKGEWFSVQIASFSDEEQAKKKEKSVPKSFVQKGKANGKTVYRVFSGKFSSKKDAQSHQKALKKKGIDGFVKQL